MNSKNSKNYVNIFETQRQIKKRKTLSRTFLYPVSNQTKLFSTQAETSVPTSQEQTLLQPTLSFRPASGRPSGIVESIKQKSSKNDLSAESVAYWQTDRLTYGGAVEEVRKSYRESLHAKDYFKTGKDYMIKNIEIQRRDSMAFSNSYRFIERKDTQNKSSYRLPSNVFERNANFNDFYQVPSSRKVRETRRPSIQDNIETVESRDATGVENASKITAHDSEELIFRLKQSDTTIQSILKYFKLNDDGKNPKKTISPKRRLSTNISSDNQIKEIKKRSKEDDLKYQIYYDLEKSITDQKEASDKSLNSLTHVSIRRGQRGTLKKGFSMAAAMYLSKMINRSNTMIKPEYKGLKKSAIKRLEKKDPIIRQTSMALQNLFKFNPKLVEVNNFRTFGRFLLITRQNHKIQKPGWTPALLDYF